jgi:hypothetical protein
MKQQTPDRREERKAWEKQLKDAGLCANGPHAKATEGILCKPCYDRNQQYKEQEREKREARRDKLRA